MRILIIACICALTSISCATPGIRGVETEKTLTIEPVANTGALSWFFPAKLPAGEYEYQVGEHKKLKVKTAIEMKLLDVNLNKMGD